MYFKNCFSRTSIQKVLARRYALFDISFNKLSFLYKFNILVTTASVSPWLTIYPSIESVIATLNPDNSKYYYFVADKNGKIYFGKNLSEHNNIIKNLKNKGLWY